MMITNVQDTSLDAFDHLKRNGILQAEQIKVLNVMIPYRLYTRRELAQKAGMDTSSVAGRVNAMLDEQVVVDGKKICSISGKNV